MIGSPVAPLVKITGNSATFRALEEDMDFDAGRVLDGSLTLAPGQSVRFRYQLFIHPGNTAQANVAAAYHAWSGE